MNYLLDGAKGGVCFQQCVPAALGESCVLRKKPFSTHCVSLCLNFSCSERSWRISRLRLFNATCRIIVQEKEFICRTLNFSIIREKQMAETQDTVLCLPFMDVRNKAVFFLVSKFSMTKGKSLPYINILGGNSHFAVCVWS